MDKNREDEACDLCLLAAGIHQRDVRGKHFYTRLGHVGEVVGCNPRASRYQWTLLIEGKRVKLQTADIDWETGPVL